MRSRRLASAAAVGSLFALSACSGILGLRDLEPYAEDGGTDAGGDGTQGDGTPGDDTSSPGDSGMGDARHDGTASDGAMEDSRTDSSTTDGPATDSTPGDTGIPPGDAPMDTVTVQDTSTGMDACAGSQTDPLNCGTCGHNCLSGGCSGGVCQPFVLTTGVTAYDLVSTGGSLYWTDQASSVWTCQIAHCNTTTSTVATMQNVTERIATNGTTLYWTNYGTGSNGSVVSLPIGGSSASILASGLQIPVGIAVDGTTLFWAETGANKVTRYSGSAMSIMDPTSASALPTGMAAGGGSVYWTDQGSGDVEKSAESAWAPSNVAASQSAPWAMTYAGTYVYWVDLASPGAVWQLTVSNNAKHQLSSTDIHPISVAADSTKVYWVDQGTNLSTSDGSVWSCDPTSCTAASLAASLSAPSSVAIDATGVYFGTVGDHQLWMAVR